NIIGNALFGSISSSAIAASTAIGGVMVPLQQKEGYNNRFAAAVNIASAPVGMVIPPSTGFIIFSLISGGTSIAALFISGAVVVRVLWAISIMIVAYISAKKNNYPLPTTENNKNKKKIVFDAIPSLLLIVIVIGGILTGIFTAIEASAICVVYSLFLALIYHRT